MAGPTASKPAPASAMRTSPWRAETSPPSSTSGATSTAVTTEGRISDEDESFAAACKAGRDQVVTHAIRLADVSVLLRLQRSDWRWERSGGCGPRHREWKWVWCCGRERQL